MIRGIIYKYTSPSGKVYIGQTINEKDRRKHFLIQKLSYGGIKIDTARTIQKILNMKFWKQDFIWRRKLLLKS